MIAIESWSAPVVPDAALDYWGEVYTANPAIRDQGVLFESFLRAPAELMAAVLLAPLQDAEPGLLPRQRATRARLDASRQIELLLEITDREIEARRLVFRDRAYVEKLAHHRHPRTPARRVAQPKGVTL